MSGETRAVDIRQTKEGPPTSTFESTVKTANGEKKFIIDVFRMSSALGERGLVNIMASYKRDGGEMKRISFLSTPIIFKPDENISDSDIAKDTAAELAKRTPMDWLLRR